MITKDKAIARMTMRWLALVDENRKLRELVKQCAKALKSENDLNEKALAVLPCENALGPVEPLSSD